MKKPAIIPTAAIITLVCSLFSVSLIHSQTLEEIKRLQKEYEEYKKAQDRKRMIELGLERELPTKTELPSQVLFKTKDIEEYYRLKLNRLKKDIEELEEIYALIDTTRRLEHFGYDFFASRDTIAFWQNLPMPKNYRLGPGDEIVISLWGETENRVQSVITRDGTIFVDDVGQLYLAGKNLQEAQKYIKNQYQNVYSTLSGRNPTTFIDISLGRLKGLNVHFTGQVKQPGIYSILPFSTVLTSLAQAGGIDIIGSLRDIQVFREGNRITSVDLYAFLAKGNMTSDIQLLDQDVIHVPVRKSVVAINGEVYRPGYYEPLTGETFQDLISYAGSLKASAGENSELRRIIPLVQRNSDDDAVYTRLLDNLELGKISPRDGDSLYVTKIMPVDKKVFVYGRVKMPGEYSLSDSMRLLDLLRLAGGIEDTSFIRTINLSRTELVRRDGSSRYGRTIKVDLIDLLKGDQSQNILLKNQDKLILYQKPNYLDAEIVEVTGEVNAPGIYPLQKENEQLIDLLDRAGGLTSAAFREGVRAYRDTITLAWKDFHFTMMGGDSIHVPRRPGVVLVKGNVYNPGYIVYRKDRSLKDYVLLAGGPTPYANPKDVIVIYPNGEVHPKRRFWSPSVEEGSTIIVNEKSLLETKSSMEMFQQTASIIGSLATLVLVIQSQRP